LLDLLSYGTLRDLRASPSLYGELHPQLLEKLKLLTLASLAAGSVGTALPYAALSAELEAPGPADVEALVVRGLYAGLVEVRAPLVPPPPPPGRPSSLVPQSAPRPPTHKNTPTPTPPPPFLLQTQGTLDQRAQVFHVTGAAGREVRPADVAALAARLAEFRSSVDGAVAAARADLARARSALADHAARVQAHEARAKAAAAEAMLRGSGGGSAAVLGALGRGDEDDEAGARGSKLKHAKRGEA
jgi:hypothetical protein